MESVHNEKWVQNGGWQIRWRPVTGEITEGHARMCKTTTAHACTLTQSFSVHGDVDVHWLLALANVWRVEQQETMSKREQTSCSAHLHQHEPYVNTEESTRDKVQRHHCVRFLSIQTCDRPS